MAEASAVGSRESWAPWHLNPPPTPPPLTVAGTDNTRLASQPVGLLGCRHCPIPPRAPHRAHRLPGHKRPRAARTRRPRRGQAPRLPPAVRAVGAPAVGDPGHRLHAGPHRLARAHRPRGALPAHVRAVVVLRRRAARGRRARADDARGPEEDMRIFLCTQIADEARHVAFFDRFYSEVGVLEADDLEARLDETSEHLNPEFGVLFDEMLHDAGGQARARARGPRDAGRGGDDLPHGHRGHARPHRPALHHRLQRADGDAAGLRRGLHERRARRAPPRRVRRALPARHGPPRPALSATRSSARWSRSARSPTACSSRRGWRAATTR